MKAIKAKLKENVPISLDGINTQNKKKGDVLTSSSGHSYRVIEHLVESGKAELIGEQEDADEKPKSNKRRKGAKQTKSNKKE